MTADTEHAWEILLQFMVNNIVIGLNKQELNK